jgi:hypothetical protein
MADRITRVRWYPAPLPVDKAIALLREGATPAAIAGYRGPGYRPDSCPRCTSKETSRGR